MADPEFYIARKRFISSNAGKWSILCYDIGDNGVWRSPASALAWGVRGPRFESGYPDRRQTRLPAGGRFCWKGCADAGT